MMRSALLLLACLTLVMLVAGEADAEKEPEWNFTTGGYLFSVAISADGEHIAAGGTDEKVYLFDKDSSTPLWSYASGNDVQTVSISADGEYIVAGSRDGKVYLFNKNSSAPLWNYDAGYDVLSVAISADGEYVAASTGYGDRTVYLFDKYSNTPLWNYTIAGPYNLGSVAISANGEYIAAGSYYGRFYLFNKDSGTPLWNYTTGGEVHSISISADGEYIAVGSQDYNVHLFNKNSSAPLWNYAAGSPVRSVAISADSKYIAAGSSDEKVYLFNRNSSTPLWNYASEATVESVSISEDGEYITAGSRDGKVYLFNKDNDAPLWNYTTGDEVHSVAISSDGEYIAAGTYANPGSVYLFDTVSSTGGPEVDYSISFSDMNVNIDVRPGASGVGCTEMLVSNHGTATIDVDVSFSGGGVTISPGAVSVTLGSGGSITVPVCALALTQSSYKNVQVTALASGRESNSQQGQVDKSSGFSVTILQYAKLSIRTSQTYSELCRDSIHNVSFTVVNNGNYIDTILIRTLNQNELENAGFIIMLPQSQITIDSGSEMMVSITVRTGNATEIVEEGIYTLIVQASTTLAGESEARSVSATLDIVECEEIAEVPSVAPIAFADKDWNSQSQVLPGDVVAFTGIGADEDGHIVLYEWDFNGDGVYEWSSSESGNTTFTFNREGTYTTVLRVTDNDGLTATDSRIITVGDSGGEDDGDDGFLPTLSVITTMAAVAVMALRRRSNYK